MGTRSPAPDTSALPSGHSGAPVRGETNPTIAAAAAAAASRPDDKGFTCTARLHRRTRTTRIDPLTHVQGEGYVPGQCAGPCRVPHARYTIAPSQRAVRPARPS